MFHVNPQKTYNERIKHVNCLSVLAAEPNEELKPKVTISPHRVQSDIDTVFEQFSNVFRDHPGNAEVVKMTIECTQEKSWLRNHTRSLKG